MISGHRHSATCILCGRRPSGFGYAPSDSHPVGWACWVHLPQAETVYKLPHTTLDAYEQIALREAGDAAGAYLDKLGQTDLALLTPEEWLIFRKTLLEEFGTSMRKQIDVHGAPF